MILRKLRYIAFTSIAVVSLVVALAAIGFFFPPTYEVSTKIPNSDSELAIQLEPVPPYLAEYRRFLVLRTNGKPDQRIEMFPDTGGYSRTQFYKLPDGLYVVRGYFDAITIDLSKRSFGVDQDTQSNGIYLGAFDKRGNSGWHFISANQGTEQSIVAGGE